ncbi:cell wall-binding repeat-containing protein [Actinokineospora soli]|uniref:Cell wall-binding repeat-containing protein n=1 Tax=Actinokineospora soli TaxID=1048753 RepID=A0ABW2TH78_9PSEU
MHNTSTRRSRALAAGFAALTAAVAFTGQAAAAPASEGYTKAQRSTVLEAGREDAARQLAMRANAAAAGPETCRTTTAGEGVTMYRYAGLNRYETAVCASFWTWYDHVDTTPDVPKANAVVLARGDAFPDALAGGPLAGYVNGPLLLTSPTTLLPSVKAEIQRVLKPGGTVYLLGGTGSLSSGVASSITSLGYTAKRLAGADRYQTAIRIAQEMPTTNLFFVTTGTNFPDALAAAPTPRPRPWARPATRTRTPSRSRCCSATTAPCPPARATSSPRGRTSTATSCC